MTFCAKRWRTIDVVSADSVVPRGGALMWLVGRGGLEFNLFLIPIKVQIRAHYCLGNEQFHLRMSAGRSYQSGKFSINIIRRNFAS